MVVESVAALFGQNNNPPRKNQACFFHAWLFKKLRGFNSPFFPSEKASGEHEWPAREAPLKEESGKGVQEVQQFGPE